VVEKTTKVGLLSLVVIVQVSIIAGGFIAYQQMSEMLWKSMNAYKHLVEETNGITVDSGLIPNPFAPLLPIVLLGLFSTIVLLIDEVRHKNEKN
jgi:hypothetical protein